MAILFDIRPIAQRLLNNQWVITASQRLASQIQSAYYHHYAKHTHAVVQQPCVLALDAWINHHWQHALLSADSDMLHWQVLSDSQEQLLWQQIITQSHHVLLQPQQTAQQAAKAYRQLQLWDVSLDHAEIQSAFLAHDDSSAMFHWCQHFERVCQKHQWLPQVKRIPLLIDYLARTAHHTDEILLIGFENVSPLVEKLFHTIGPTEHYRPTHAKAQIRTVECPSPQEEYYAAAVWAKQCLTDNPHATIAIIVPDLAQQYFILRRIVQAVFEPDTFNPTSPRHTLSFNISSGYPLNDAPLIQAALHGLKLCRPSIDNDTAYAILASPFYKIDDQMDAQALAQLVDSVHELRQFTIRTAKLRELANQAAQRTNPHWPFAKALQQHAQQWRAIKPHIKRPPSQWATIFTQLLHTIGWPGKRPLDSEEYQQMTQWHVVISHLCEQDTILPIVSFQRAFNLLQELLSSHLFQSQTPYSALQILGTLEGHALHFSHVWLTSMTAQQWPATPQPNPLLPIRLQRQYAMPHADANRELMFARYLIASFTHNTQQLVISYAQKIDGNPTALSSLLQTHTIESIIDLLGRPLTDHLPTQRIRHQHQNSVPLETIVPGHAPLLTTSATVKGGSMVLADQSACPFRAFAKHRLHIQAPPKPCISLSTLDRGLLVHDALENIWHTLHCKANLLALSHTEQKNLCKQAASSALKKWIPKRLNSLGSRYQQLEQQRITQLLNQWLSLERERADFSIKYLETHHTWRYAQLELTLRIDRIDQLADGSLMIMDYKTTNHCRLARWSGERPDEPQLPLYYQLIHALDNHTVSGVAFAQIRIEDHKLIGAGDEHCLETSLAFDKVHQKTLQTNTWQQLTQQWLTVLTTLADDFIHGKANRDPKASAQTCQYCDLSDVCRVQRKNGS